MTILFLLRSTRTTALFSEYGIAYWERRFIPVVKIDGRVAGLFPNYIDAEFYTPDKGHRFVEV